MTFNSIPAGELIQESTLHDARLDESELIVLQFFWHVSCGFTGINFLGGILCALQRLLLTFFVLLFFS
jgi:hypothetical protein